jgi:CheY-like chemotaxis protein
MKILSSRSISKKLVLLVMVAVLPTMALLLYTGMEQRQRSIEDAKRDILLLTHTMAEVQIDIAKSTRQILSTLALLPEIQSLNLQASSQIFAAVLKQHPGDQNITLTALNEDVLASGLPSAAVNLADPKHVREAVITEDFAAGEYIVSRVGTTAPAFAFANPVRDPNGRLKAVLTTSMKLDRFSRLYDLSTLPENSFLAVTDHQGIRLFFYPPKDKTNPIGKPIIARPWHFASNAKEPGIFTGEGSDYLPASAQQSAKVGTSEEANMVAHKSKILVMDDEELVRKILQAMLHQLRHAVMVVRDGIEAVRTYEEAMANEAPIDLIIMDLTIPGGMGGKEAVQKI